VDEPQLGQRAAPGAIAPADGDGQIVVEDEIGEELMLLGAAHLLIDELPELLGVGAPAQRDRHGLR
jgi:hypothetical protein